MTLASLRMSDKEWEEVSMSAYRVPGPKPITDLQADHKLDLAICVYTRPQDGMGI